MILCFQLQSVLSQCGTGTSTIYNVNFSAAKDTSWTLNASRGGTACVGTPGADDRCIRFNITLNAGSDLLNFSADQLTGASFYSINCGPLIPIGTPACITGLTSACISFCKPGNNSVNYTISASSIIKGSADIVLRQNCSGTMSVTGVSAASVNWRSIFPGASGTYNSYLSATSGVTSVTVTPQTGAPEYIDYEVSGTGACPGVRNDTIRVYTVPPMLLSVNPVNPAICNGASVVLTGTITGGNPPYTYSWNTGSSSSSISVSTPAAYTLTVSDNTVGCPAVQQVANVLAAPTPAPPTAPGVAICSGTSATLNVSGLGGDTFQWYDAITGGSLLATGASFITPILTANRNYFVQTTVGGCTSTRTTVAVTVNSIPVVPTVSGVSICAGTTASLTATGSTGNYEWYDAPSAGTLLSSSANFITPSLTNNTTYYVQAMNGSCAGPRTAVNVTVNSIPANPTIAGASICSGSSATLTATAPGGNYEWWTASSGGTSLGTDIAYNTGTLTTTTTYYVETTVNGCKSVGRSAVTVTVNATPTMPNITGTGICGGTSTGLSITSPVIGETYRWYDQSTGGNLLQIGTSYTTPVLNAITNYYVSATSSSGCTSNRQTFTLNVTPIQDPVFTYPSSTFCKTDPSTPTPTVAAGVSGTFSSSSPDLVINTTTGAINLAASLKGTYIITLSVSSGSCIYSRNATINIIDVTPNPNFDYGTGQFCVNQANVSASFTATGGIPGVFTSTAGLTFQNSSTGEINFSQTDAGSYVITNTITGSGGCATVSATSVINVAPPPVANAGVNLVACEGQPITLNGIVSGTASSGVWSIVGSASQGAFSNNTSLTSTFTPSIGQTFVTLRLTTDDPAGACSAVSDDLIVEVKPTPSIPTVTTSSICAGTSATLIATAPGGTYRWYDVSSGGSELISPATTFTTPNLFSNKTYYVSVTSSDNCTSNRQPVIVTVKQLPVVSSPATGEICSGINQNYMITADIPGSSFSWSRVAVVNITNSVVVGQNASNITEALNSIVSTSVPVVYQIIPTADGCSGPAFNYTVTVKPVPVTPVATSTAICEGETIKLSTPERVGASYSWTGPNGFVSNIQSPEIPNALKTTQEGTYTIRVIENGCLSLPGSANQIVKTKPAAPVVSNTSPACIGASFSLNTPIVIGASYSWTGPGFSSTDQNPTITNAQLVSAGTYSLSIAVDGCSSNSSSTNVVVNTPPAQVDVTSTGPVCVSEELRLIAQELPAASYTWTGPNGFSSTSRIVTLPNMSNTIAGAYQVIASVGGCVSVANSIDASLKPTPAAPTINPIAAVCENGTIQLNASFVNNATYNWSGPLGYSNNTQNPTILSASTTMAGNYSVRIVVDGCPSATSSIDVVVNPLPAAPVLSTGGPVCAGSTLQLNAVTVSGASYNWSGPLGFASSNQNPLLSNVSLANAGAYTASISVNGCAGPTSTVNAIINPIPGPVNVSSSGPACLADPLTVSAEPVPNAIYSWTGPNNFTSASREFTIPSMSSSTAGTYQLTVSVAGCSGSPNLLNATLKPTPNAPTIDPVSPICENGTLILNAGLVSGATYSWTGPLGFISNTQSPAITSVTTSMAGNYAASIIVNGCRSAASVVNVVVNPLPAAPTLSSGGAVCVGNTLQLNAAAVTGASYQWTGPSGFVSADRNPVIANASLTNAGTYTAFMRVNGCPGPTSSITAIVNPLPGPVNINSSGAVCQGRPLQLTADSVTAGVYAWTGPNGFTANTRSISFTSMNSATAGVYQVAVAVAGCPGAANSINAVLKPTPAAPLINTISPVCENGPLQLRLNAVSGAIYSWSGPMGFTSIQQNPVIDSVKLNRSGIYTANITVDGCISNNSSVSISVIPEPRAPIITSNSPVCVNDVIQLRSNNITGAIYQWGGVNGFISSVQNPLITTASLSDTGTYRLAVIVNGCISDTSFVQVLVDRPAEVNAGNNQVVCANNAQINLSGNISGGTITGIWSTNGTGRFGTRTLSLNNTYLPSSLDTALGSVQLTLTSTNNGGCRPVSSSIIVQITDAPIIDVGNNKVICGNDSLLNLNAQFSNAGGLVWSTTGSGVFESLNAANTNYVLSDRDRTLNSFRIIATTTDNGSCLAVKDSLLINLAPVPVVNAGKDVFVFENTPYTLNPIITGNIQSYKWSPANFLSNALLRNPIFRGNADQLLTLTVESANGCVATDEILITVVKPFPIPNVFSPNGDGIHDTWVIPELDKYPNAIVNVFDRYGRRVFFTEGYKRPWDGTFNGKPLAVATYYYIIEPKLIPGIFSGSVTIIK